MSIYILSDTLLLLGVSDLSLISDLLVMSDLDSSADIICSTMRSIMSAMTTRDGSTIKLMKPIWDWAIGVLFRSHSGEKGKPNSFSLSPYKYETKTKFWHLITTKQTIWQMLWLFFVFCLPEQKIPVLED